MAKSSKHTAQEFYSLGESSYKQATVMEDRQESQIKINAAWGLAAGDFWMALVLGSKNAPYSLYACFGQGLGVHQDDYIANLMFGVALKLNDPKCQKGIKCKNLLNTMGPQIDSLYKLIIQTQFKIPDSGVDMSRVFTQMDIFDQAIKLPSGQTMTKCFINNNNEATHDSVSVSNVYHGDDRSDGTNDYHKFPQQQPLIGQDSHHNNEDCCYTCVIL